MSYEIWEIGDMRNRDMRNRRYEKYETWEIEDMRNVRYEK